MDEWILDWNGRGRRGVIYAIDGHCTRRNWGLVLQRSGRVVVGHVGKTGHSVGSNNWEDILGVKAPESSCDLVRKGSILHD